MSWVEPTDDSNPQPLATVDDRLLSKTGVQMWLTYPEVVLSTNNTTRKVGESLLLHRFNTSRKISMEENQWPKHLRKGYKSSNSNKCSKLDFYILLLWSCHLQTMITTNWPKKSITIIRYIWSLLQLHFHVPLVTTPTAHNLKI